MNPSSIVSGWNIKDVPIIKDITPAIVNKDGVREKIRIPLDEHETKLIKESMKVISDAIKSVE